MWEVLQWQLIREAAVKRVQLKSWHNLSRGSHWQAIYLEAVISLELSKWSV